MKLRHEWPCAGVLLAGVLACAGLCGASTLSELLARSDSVAIASPVSVSSAYDGSRITLSVVSWLSGGAGNTVTVLWKEPGLRAPGAAQFALGMWFLKESGGGLYTVVPARPMVRPGFRDLYFDAAPAEMRPAALEYATDEELKDKIALELLAAAARGTADYRPEDIVGAIGGGASAKVRDAFTYLSRLPGSRPKAIGLAGLISVGDPAGVIGLERELSRLAQDDLAGVIAGPLFGSWRNPDRAAASSLGRVLTRPGTPYRLLLLGAKALSYIHTADALPYLVKLLDSTDREVRVDAVRGLWMFANGVAIQDPKRIDSAAYLKPRPTAWSEQTRAFVVSGDASDEKVEECVRFWKGWWLSHEGEVTP